VAPPDALEGADTEAAMGGNDEWWRGAVIYQIYPRSFLDSDGDGVGDLSGIARRLAHVAALGADAVWIAPFFASPMKDFGYDVADYRAVDPMFGSIEDFRAVVAEARRLGLKVLIDLVISHSSDRHPWFVESRSSRDNARADWYVWADPKPDGTAPNNWLSIFGGPAWEWDSRRRQYYLHNFLAAQPDLNFHNPAVQDEMLSIARHWLALGADGFRLDTVNFYFHDRSLADNPALPPERRDASTAPEVNPYNWQDHRFDKSQPENLGFLKRLRAVLDEFPGTTSIGEVGDGQRGLALMGEYTAGRDRLHMCYSFDFLSDEKPTPSRVRRIVETFGAAAPDGWACWALSNHDVVRPATRWAASEADPHAYLAMIMALLFCLRGSICLYQGEELGLTEAELSFDELRDPYGLRFWPDFKGRDGCRTPMPWQADAPSLGFTDGQPWLPLPAAHRALAVDRAEARPDSLLRLIRDLVGLRRGEQALRSGSIHFVDAGDDVVAFTRSAGDSSLVCAFNLTAAPAELALPGPATALRGPAPDGRVLRLGAYGWAVARLAR